MEQVVHIPVEYQGVEREFEARVQVWQYGHRFFVQVEGVELAFERDDSGEYRALAPEGYTGKLPDGDWSRLSQRCWMRCNPLGLYARLKEQKRKF